MQCRLYFPLSLLQMPFAARSRQEAVRHRASYADAYTGMGVSLKELKRKEEAEQCFAQVVRLRPGCALSLGNLAGIVLSDADSAWA